MEIDSHPRHDDEVTLGEFLKGVAGLLRWAKHNIIGLALCILIGAGVSVYIALQKPTNYNAHLTFMLTDNNAGQMAGLSSVLGQLGIPFSSGKLNIDKLMEVAKARRITTNTLLSTVTTQGKSDLLANHYLHIYELPSTWAEKNEEFASFKFENTTEEALTNQEQHAIKKLHQLLIGGVDNRDDALVQMGYGNPDYIMSFDVGTLDEELSIHTANLLFEKLKEFYVAKAITNYQEAFDLVKSKRDSISVALASTEYRVAQLKDRSANTYANTNSVNITSLSAQVFGLREALQEAEKSLGVAEYALRTNKPAIDLLDAPIGPLAPSNPSFLKYLIFGIIGGMALYIIFYLGRLVIKLV